MSKPKSPHPQAAWINAERGYFHLLRDFGGQFSKTEKYVIDLPDNSFSKAVTEERKKTNSYFSTFKWSLLLRITFVSFCTLICITQIGYLAAKYWTFPTVVNVVI